MIEIIRDFFLEKRFIIVMSIIALGIRFVTIPLSHTYPEVAVLFWFLTIAGSLILILRQTLLGGMIVYILFSPRIFKEKE